MREVTTGPAMTSFLAVMLALVVGGVLIAVTDKDVQSASSYLFLRPGDAITAAWQAVSGAYTALFHGAVFNPHRLGLLDQFKPLTDTFAFAVPLIAAGLGVGLAFRVGLFNIGGQGQMLIAAACAGWVGFAVDLPWGIHVVVALIAGLVGGSLWAGIAGALKARTGAHEVIMTIMLNYIAFYLVAFLLRSPVLKAPGSDNPKSPPMDDTAVLPSLLGPAFNLNAGLPLVVGATVYVWWLLNRSALGFHFRAVGLNPSAARVAGIDVKRVYVLTMAISGAFVGFAGVNQVLGPLSSGFSSGVDAGIGFDAITVALLGRSRPWGIFVAGTLFGAFKAGGFAMQATQGVPIDIVLVVQSLIVLFIAAPPLIRAVFHVPDPASTVRPRPPMAATTPKVIAK
jgi:simple sugar transport system permease protein